MHRSTRTRTRKLLLAAPALLLGALAAGPAHAGDVSGAQLTVGGKVGGSGNLLTEPDNAPVGFSAPFEEGAGGGGVGGGLFAELRVLRGFLGIETGLSADYARAKSSITYNDVVETEWGWGVTSLRIPLLIQGASSDAKRMPRFSLGVGPEFMIPVKADPRLEITQGEQYVPNPESFDDDFTLRTRPQVNLLVNIGVGIPMGPLRFMIDLRYALNLGLPKDYDDRVTLDYGNPAIPNVDVLAQSHMDLRLTLGLGYDFVFGKKKK